MSNETLEERAEALARTMAEERGMPGSMFELFLPEAYSALFPRPEAKAEVSDEQ